MIVVAVLAILASIAFPIYTDQIERARYSEPRTLVLMIAQHIEQYAALQDRYCPACTDGSAHAYAYRENADGTVATNTMDWLPDFRPRLAIPEEAARYDYTITAIGFDAYVIDAEPLPARNAPEAGFQYYRFVDLGPVTLECTPKDKAGGTCVPKNTVDGDPVASDQLYIDRGNDNEVAPDAR